MYAVVNEVELDPSRQAEAGQLLKEFVVPAAKALTGFKRGTWVRSLDGTRGRGFLLFDSEDNATAAVEQIRTQGPPAGAPVTIMDTTAYEVLAEA